MMWRNNNALNVLLWVVVMVSALSVVTSQHKARKLFVALQHEKEHTQEMEVEWGQLQLEQSTWAAPVRVEKIATRQLQMFVPNKGQVRFVRIKSNSGANQQP